MPEDANPQLLPDSDDNQHYFTLPMALNYQRSSYTLWESARATYLDEMTRWVFRPRDVLNKDSSELRQALQKHKLALQPVKHTDTWFRLCVAICDLLAGRIGSLFSQCDSRADEILQFVQVQHKKMFPYLSGKKICNYWLFVMSQYGGVQLKNRAALSVAPDTHVVQASVHLGLVGPNTPDIQEVVAARWRELLEGTPLTPIDVHTPLWLWSRAGFPRPLLTDSQPEKK